MQYRPHLWRAAFMVLALGVAGVWAQDYSTHRGDNQRAGQNAAANTYGPGQANLRWWHPASVTGASESTVRDNTSKLATRVGTWLSPSTSDEASFPFIPQQTGVSAVDSLVSSFFDPTDANYGLRPIVPAYQYAPAVPSRSFTNYDDYDPTIPSSGTARTFTWDVTPAVATEQNYAVYVWIPTGPTDVNPGAPISNAFPQRYFVFEVLYSGKRFVEVVDTSVAGTGWVRLGNGGATTEKLFSYSGSGSFQVRLYNTIPRGRDGTLLGGSSSGSAVSLVYADGAMISPVQGSYSASTIINLLSDAVTSLAVGARNESSVSASGNSVTTGVVRAFDLASGAVQWTFSPSENNGRQVVVDAPSSQVIANPPLWQNQTTATGFLGTGYYASPLVADEASATDVRYTPTLEPGEYSVSMWLAGSNSGQNFARQTVVEIREGTTVSQVIVDQDGQSRWVRLGSRLYTHSATAPLTVRVLNYSTSIADFTESRLAYADAISFNGSANLAVMSTPLQVNGALVKMSPTTSAVPQDVTFVASEDGRIYCLESDSSSTPRVLWAYPSVKDPTDPSWEDPNHTSGEDGEGPVAQMPTAFDLSSALVQRINGQDYLFIASRNGRVYCLDVAGRGDMNLASGRAGTTTRVWTWPDDYPATSKTTSLGAFTGSIAYADTAAGPTIFVPAPQGRLYALDALGTTNKRTTVRWQYPALDQPTLGDIRMTPTVAFGNVYFGTLASLDERNGEFYALDADDGTLVWKFDGTTTEPADSFVADPVAVAGLLLGAGQPDVVYVANENRRVYALDAHGSGGTTTVLWSTDELATSFAGGLVYTPLRIINNIGTLEANAVPCIVVPTADGRLVGLLAGTSTADVNRYGTKRVWEYVLAGSLTGSPAVGRNWMTVADQQGYIYGFNNDAGLPITPGDPPGIPGIVENNPVADNYRNAKVKLIDRATYLQLRAGTLDYAGTEAAAEVTGAPLTFEWGERIYIVVYGFPHDTTTPDDDTVAPPSANFQFSVEGATTRSQQVESRQFGLLTNTNPPSASDGQRLDGYAILDFAIQSGGANAIPPGDGKVTASIVTRALNDNGQPQTVALDPTQAVREFKVANPLALVLTDPTDLARTIGYTVVGSNPENLINGSNVPGTQKNALLSSIGLTTHGQTGGTTISVVDRSLMRLLRGPGRGLDNVRVETRDLNWLGGTGAVMYPLDATLFPNYEDLPGRYPNDSLDYPNISAGAIQVTKDVFGGVENPLFGPVSLNPPTFPDEANPVPADRRMQATPFDFAVEVPKFQPPNATLLADSTSLNVVAGYANRLYVLVDSNGNGALNNIGGRREAYRSFRLASPVEPDEKFSVTTPVVDAGELPVGAGYSPVVPWDPTSPLSPITGPFAGLFKPFTLVNDGNVNLLNLRLAKATQLLAGAISPWPIYSPTSHDLAWLETAGNVFSSLDPDARWALVDDLGNTHSNVVAQKARVGDRVGTELNLNAHRRANPVLGVDQQRLSATAPDPYLPSVAVTVPIGFPSGTYQQVMRVINEVQSGYPANQALSLDQYGAGLEAYSDPTFNLRFTVREARLTNSYTKPFDAPMIDDLVGGAERFLHSNIQPSVARHSNGSLVVAWSSSRESFTAPQPGADPNLNPENRIYLSTLHGQSPQGTSGPSNLRDLNYFAPNTTNRWFSQPVDMPYPDVDSQIDADTLFGVDTANGHSVVTETVRFFNPTFPAEGFEHAFNGSDLSTVNMAFVGEAQVQTPTGRINQSRLFVAPVTIGAGGTLTIGAPVRATKDDPGLRKGRMGVVQSGQYTTVFFGAGSAANAQIYHTSYDPTAPNANDRWSQVRTVSLGTGFESVSSPSVVGRTYNGPSINQGGYRLVPRMPLLEITFVGKLRSRPNSEVFLARMASSPLGVPQGLIPLPYRNSEVLTSVGSGTYRSEGLVWNLRAPITLNQVLNGTLTDLEVAGTRRVDSSTGIITFETKLGGRATLDPNAGTIRFGTSVPANNAVLLLNYQPNVLRVSGPGQTASHNSANLQYDNRLIGDAGYWVRPTSPPQGLTNADSDQVRSGRYVVAYGRSASGNGQAARPYLRTMRFGVQLPASIFTNPDGTVGSFTVTGATAHYQLDPARGRIYFTDADENRTVTVAFQGVAEDGTPVTVSAREYQVGLVWEQEEAPIPIAQAVNESSPFLTLDPFDPAGTIGSRRPGLIWMVWTSTRAGAPDIYLQTIAPRLIPVPSGK